MGSFAGWSFSTSESITVALAGVLLVLVSITGYRAWKASRVPPEERERRRRLVLVAHGKMGDATLVDAQEDHLFYTYGVRGVEYTASQDVSFLKEYLPQALPLSAPVSVRYDPRNPANSIVLSEQWTGLRRYSN